MRAFFCLLLAFACTTVHAQSAQSKPDTFPLQDVLTQVNLALQDYQIAAEQSNNKLPALKFADFDFKTSTSKSVGASFTFFIFTLGGSHSHESANEVVFHYEVPEPPKSQPHALTAPVQLREQLTKTIEAAAQALHGAPELKGLAFTRLAVNISYGVTWSVNGGISVPMLVTSGLNAKKDHNSIQTLHLEFAD